MSAQQSHDLQAACRRILRRLQEHRNQSMPCFLCGIFVVGGEEKLMAHLSQRHSVSVCHFSDVVDFDGFMACLKERAVLDKQLRCPVCLAAVGEGSATAALRAHVEGANHAEWNPVTIPELAVFCLAVEGRSSGVAAGTETLNSGTDTDDEEEDIRNRGENDEDPDGVEEDDDWNDACTCLYCPEVSEECLEHMAHAHHFDLRETTRTRPDIVDEYDIIRLINDVRRCVAAGQCPYFHNAAPGEEEAQAPVSPCVFDGTLEEHLLQHPEHRLPKAISRQSDAGLIPVLAGDALLSLVVTAGEGFLPNPQEDPDFPLAPTLQQVAAHGVALSRKAAMKRS